MSSVHDGVCIRVTGSYVLTPPRPTSILSLVLVGVEVRMQLWIFTSLHMNMRSREGRGRLGRRQARAVGLVGR
eukprot:scaffold89043_cov30-Tisochrysis_lutea.AAC.1